MPPDAPSAFFSYSRDDSEFVLRLAEDLKTAGAHVWLDQLDIQPGQRWVRAVQDALNDAPCMLVILSPSSAASTHVDDEVNFALEEHKTVIPILYLDCKVPFQLRPFQYVDFRADYAGGVKALLKTLPAEPRVQMNPPLPSRPIETRPIDSYAERQRAAEQAQGQEERGRLAGQARLEEGATQNRSQPPILSMGDSLQGRVGSGNHPVGRGMRKLILVGATVVGLIIAGIVFLPKLLNPAQTNTTYGPHAQPTVQKGISGPASGVAETKSPIPATENTPLHGPPGLNTLGDGPEGVMILEASPPSGARLKQGQPAEFTVTVLYRLTSLEKATLSLGIAQYPYASRCDGRGDIPAEGHANAFRGEHTVTIPIHWTVGVSKTVTTKGAVGYTASFWSDFDSRQLFRSFGTIPGYCYSFE